MTNTAEVQKPVVTVFDIVDRVTKNPPEVYEVPDVAFEQLVQYVYRYKSSLFDAKAQGITRKDAQQIAAILIRTKLMPTLNGGTIDSAFQLAKKENS